MANHRHLFPQLLAFKPSQCVGTPLSVSHKPLRCPKALVEKRLEPCTLRRALKSSSCRDLKVHDARAHFGLQGVLLDMHPKVSITTSSPVNTAFWSL